MHNEVNLLIENEYWKEWHGIGLKVTIKKSFLSVLLNKGFSHAFMFYTIQQSTPYCDKKKDGSTSLEFFLSKYWLDPKGLSFEAS